MAEKLMNIFLSASIPDSRRDPKYWETSDIIAIRDAVRALATEVLPKARLIWGGHPAITPLISLIAKNIGVNLNKHVVLYQSEFFRDKFPQENEAIEQIKITPAGADRDASLEIMRASMIKENNFSAGFFIGGMEGVEKEFELFRKFHSDAPFYPIASTGAAALILWDKYCSDNEELRSNLAYGSLFRGILRQIEKSKVDKNIVVSIERVGSPLLLEKISPIEGKVSFPRRTIDEIIEVLVNKNIPNEVKNLELLTFKRLGDDLQRIDLQDADLQGADLQGFNLQGANMQKANLQLANLSDANLQGANLLQADLRGANLQLANLSDASLQGANLLQTDLRGANLQLANLSDTNLQGANYNRQTTFPSDFNPKSHGMRLDSEYLIAGGETSEES